MPNRGKCRAFRWTAAAVLAVGLIVQRGLERRDVLALELDVASLLPSDSSSYGFDNVTVGNLSPTLLESYVSAAEPHSAGGLRG